MMNSGLFCDLHVHSTCSDGTLTPREVVQLAKDAELAAVAVTDHDTIGGVAEAQAAGRDLGIIVLSGVEISVEYTGKTVHMLGYCFDSAIDRLRAALDRLVAGRHERNRKIVERLNALGLALTYDEVLAEAGGKVVGRPHFARVLLRHGYVASWQEAFDQYLARGAAAYVERLRFSPEDSVRLIREAGGIAVLAHPKLVPLAEGEQIEQVIERLVAAGLQGIECYYSLHSDEETAQYLEIAKRFGLIVTGGTDFHGATKPDTQIGVGHGKLRVPLACAEALMRAAA